MGLVVPIGIEPVLDADDWRARTLRALLEWQEPITYRDLRGFAPRSADSRDYLQWLESKGLVSISQAMMERHCRTCKCQEKRRVTVTDPAALRRMLRASGGQHYSAAYRTGHVADGTASSTASRATVT
jgi:hypothetical protein